MSVLKNNRSVAKIAYYSNALTIQKEIIAWTLKDFGIKAKVRSIDLIANFRDIEPSDVAILKGIEEKYGLNSHITEEYPVWFIARMRDRLLNSCHALLSYISAAHAFQTVSNVRQFYDRQSYQNRAIGALQDLNIALQFVINNMPVDVNRVMRIEALIVKERDLLKTWRKKCNKQFALMQEQVKKESEQPAFELQYEVEVSPF